MRKLKADFHTHTSDDPYDHIDHSAEMLIDAAAQKGVELLAITNHGTLLLNDYLAEYAHRQGILLLPGMEAFVEGKHVLLLNPTEEMVVAHTFDELRRARSAEAVVIAPHPFFPSTSALGTKLIEHIDVFDAIEYHSFYAVGINFNRRACRVARHHGLPMVGNSDTHVLPYDDSTFSLVDAECTVESVVSAIRRGVIEVKTKARPLQAMANMSCYAIADWMYNRGGPSVDEEAAL